MGQGVVLWNGCVGTEQCLRTQKSPFCWTTDTQTPLPHTACDPLGAESLGAPHVLSQGLSVQACQPFMCLRDGLDQPVDVQSKLSASP